MATLGRFASANSGSNWTKDNSIRIVKAGTATGTNLGLTTSNWPTSETAQIYGSSSSITWGTTLTPADLNNTNFGLAVVANLSSNGFFNTVTASIDYVSITVSYQVDGVVNWYTASSGGVLLGSGSPFNPVGVSGSGLGDTNTPGITTFYAECSTQPGCRTATVFEIKALPDKPVINNLDPLQICTTSSITVRLESSTAAGYQWYKNGNLISGATSQIYTASETGDYTVRVTGSNGCTSIASDPVSVTSTVPSIILETSASTCVSTTADQSTSMAYSGAINLPVTYSITSVSGFLVITDANLTGGTIPITIPANTPAGNYTGSLTVKNAAGCISLPIDFTISVNPYPVATFHYVKPLYCQSEIRDLEPVINAPAQAGIFTGTPAGLAFDGTIPGKLNPALSTPGTYLVTNTVTVGGCTSFATTSVVIDRAPTVSISYSMPNLCNVVTTPQNVTRTLIAPTTLAFGSYSASPVGLTINTNSDLLDPLAGQIIPSTSLPNTYTVTYAFGDGNCSNTVTTTVIIYAQPSITGQPSASAEAYCENGTASPLTVSANPGAGATIENYEWFSNTSASTSGAISVGSGAGMSSYVPLTTSVGTLYYYCIVTDTHGCSATSDFSGPVKISPPIQNNLIFGENTICSTEPIVELPGSMPTGGDGNFVYEWRSSTDGVTFNTVVGTSQNFTPSGLLVNTWYVRTVTSGGCTDTSAPIKITVIPGPASFDVTGESTICWGESTNIILSGSEPGVQYQLRDNSNNLIGAALDGDGFPITFSTGILTATTTYNVLAYNTLTRCTGQMSGTPTVTVIPAITENSIGSSQTACPGSAPLRLDGSVPVGGIGNFLYKWQISFDNFSTYSDASGVNDGQNYYPDIVTSDTWYRRIVISDICSSLSNIVKMTLGALPAVVSVDGPAGGRFCGSATLTASLVNGTGTIGTIYYQNTISGGKDIRYPQSSISVNASGTYYFRAYNVATGCWGPEGSFTVALDLPPATLGTTICQDQTGYLTAAAQCPSPVSSVTEFAGTGADDASIGTITWTNPGNIVTTGNATASSVPENGITHYLKATNFNFSIPAGAAIQGVSVSINHSSSGNISPYIRDNSVRLIQGGSIAGSNRAHTTTDWPTVMGTATYGGPTDTWGTTNLTAGDINASSFGVALSAINSSTASTFPVVAGTATSDEPTSTNTHHITLPSGIQPNDLLLIFWSDRERQGATVPIPAGWTELYRNTTPGYARHIAWYKIANGSEGTQVTITSGGGTIRSAHNSYRIAAGTYAGLPV